MYVLELEEEGDYGDFYERPTIVAAVSKDKDKLENMWSNLKIAKETTEFKYRFFEGDLYIDYNIYKVEVL